MILTHRRGNSFVVVQTLAALVAVAVAFLLQRVPLEASAGLYAMVGAALGLGFVNQGQGAARWVAAGAGAMAGFMISYPLPLAITALLRDSEAGQLLIFLFFIPLMLQVMLLWGAIVLWHEKLRGPRTL